MSGNEPKKLVTLRILQILQEYSDEQHPLIQKDIADILRRDYGMEIERKAIGRNISFLKDAGFEIKTLEDKDGCYLAKRIFSDFELRVLIDGVITEKFITKNYSNDLIERLASLASPSFRERVRYMCAVESVGKTENQQVFLNVETVEEAIFEHKRIYFDYYKYGKDKKLRLVKKFYVSPYLTLMHNQRYYLMAKSEESDQISYYRLDYIKNIEKTEIDSTPITEIKGYEKGINYQEFNVVRPYLYVDKSERVEFVADEYIIDQVIDWFGKDIIISDYDEKRVKVTLLSASPKAMEYWALQYSKHVTVIYPEHLVERIKKDLLEAIERYKNIK